MNPAFMLLVVNLNTNSENNPLPIPPRKKKKNQVELMTKKGSNPEIKTVNGRKIYHILTVTKLPPGNSSALKVAEILKNWEVPLYACAVKHQLLAFVRHWIPRSFFGPV